MSPVNRLVASLPPLIVPAKKRLTVGALLTRLIEPPAEPRPVKAEPGPLTTSTCSRLKGSRDCGPRSRAPSTKMSLRALNPRSVRLSPAGAPPSPAVIVKPGTLRSTSRSVVAPCSSLELEGVAASVEIFGRITASSPKYTEPLRDTPQTLTVIPKTVIEEQGATTLRDVLRNVPGLTMTAGEGGAPAGDNLTLRGFSARNDIFIDGARDLGPQS